MDVFSSAAYPGAIIGRLAIAAGAIGLLSFLLAILAFVFGRPFGIAADVLVAAASALNAGLAMVLLPEQLGLDGQIPWIAFGSAMTGSFLGALGGILAATQATGWFRAQLYMGAGYAFTGGWLLLTNVLARSAHTFPNRAVNMGLFAGTVMLLGMAALPGLNARSESEQGAPWLSRRVGRAGYLGWALLYPIWCIWLGASRLGS